MMELLKLTNICKAWPDGQAQMLPVLEGLDLTLDKGEFIAVTGVSGSGKTTLLQILGTLVPPDAGSYRFDGTELTAPGVDLDAFRNRRLGFVFQDHRLLPYLSVRENILLPALAGQDAASGEQAARARELMDLTGISGLSERAAGSLSGGESARTALCRALLMQPDLLLADEPTGQLDRDNAARTATLLREVCSQLGTSVVLVTHDERTAAVADTIYRLEDKTLRR